MIYETKTQALLTLFEIELERFGKYDANGVTPKAKKAKDRANALVQRLLDLGVPLPNHVRVIE